ncbi:unnamed protein product [Dovyalis caffra]|uniref:Lipoxygenase n=1 Tax=Dovyalis caffra TaxID=77055 RepID=A0AAV1RRE3_9ROSI|nr:unnamed protein product [Dovyalis caffra]
MSMPLSHQSLYPSRTSLLLPKPCNCGNSHVTFPVRSRSSFTKTNRNGWVGCKPSNIKAIPTETSVLATNVKATVTVLDQRVDGADILPETLSLELVFSKLDPKTNEERSFKAQLERKVNGVLYEADIDEVSLGYGEVGAVYVTNDDDNKIFVKKIALEGQFILTCKSWVENKQKRLFFTNKSTYLPSQTPSGLRRLRKEELVSLRGDGKGERKQGDRIYDYDVYNDLDVPNTSPDSIPRPVLGGKEHPYPRRCRTGRLPTQKGIAAVKAGLSTIEDGFGNFAAIDVLFNEGIKFKEKKSGFIIDSVKDFLKELFGRARNKLLRFPIPEVMRRDRFSWFRDEEFARQTLAGVNPSCIQLVTEWPLRSKLDPNIYGRQESAITANIIKEDIKGFETVEEAIERKKLFILDYHDLLLPFVRQVRELGNRTLHGSRTLFFLTPQGTLKPLAIELTRPPMDGKPQWKQVFTPTGNATGVWLWKLAKANVLAHDSAYHQLITHWLRTHCATEPYIIAANRQLSAMHPIYRLLHPHFRYTMKINAEARNFLINADGIIETTFALGKYSMELSSVIYDKHWRFDHEGLPKDLIIR